MRKLSVGLVIALIIIGCDKDEKDRICQCTNSVGTIVIDTVFHATSDEAYQLCQGHEFDSEIDNCQSYE